MRDPLNRLSGNYWVRCKNGRWEIAHWNKTYQYWIFRLFGTEQVNDDYWAEVDERRITREPNPLPEPNYN